MHSLIGQFLIGMPKLRGSVFGDTLIYLWAHDEEGAQGLVVNRPHELTLLTLLGQLELASSGEQDAHVVEGGPVEPQRGFILHTGDVGRETSDDAGQGLRISYNREILDLIAAGQGPKQFLVALGFAGWGPGQLERELADSAWLTAPGSLELLFDVPLEERLDRAAASLGIDMRLLGVEAGHA